jgi:hypothetical protein
MKDGIRDVQSQWIVLLHAQLGIVPFQGCKLSMPAPGLRCRSSVPLTQLPHAVTEPKIGEAGFYPVRELFVECRDYSHVKNICASMLHFRTRVPRISSGSFVAFTSALVAAWIRVGYGHFRKSWGCLHTGHFASV